MTTYKQELISLEGIGEKTAQKIMERYPSREDLLLAVQNGENINFNQEICEKITEYALKHPKKGFLMKGMIELQCSVPNIKIIRHFNPRINIEIGETGKVFVRPEVAEYLVKDSRFKKKTEE